jgi:hypothetical protein
MIRYYYAEYANLDCRKTTSSGGCTSWPTFFEEVSFALDFNGEAGGIESVAFYEFWSQGTRFVPIDDFGKLPLRWGTKRKVRPSHREYEFVLLVEGHAANLLDCWVPLGFEDIAEFPEEGRIGEIGTD